MSMWIRKFYKVGATLKNGLLRLGLTKIPSILVFNRTVLPVIGRLDETNHTSHSPINFEIAGAL
jgi:hypothetical protein